MLLNDDAVVNVVEADEYDRSFLKLCPNESVITAMDPDHMDIYGTHEAMFDAYTQFAILCDGPLLVHERIADHFKDREQCDRPMRSEVPVYHVQRTSVWWMAAYHFDLIAEGHELKDLRLGMPGRHNVENAIAASTVALRLGVDAEFVARRPGLVPRRCPSFRNADPRSRSFTSMTMHITPRSWMPASPASVRCIQEDAITGIFQPHLYTRTRDLAADFAQSLAALDELILLDIYPAREEPIEGIDSDLAAGSCAHGGQSWFAPVRTVSITCVTTELDVVVTHGAGDIDRLVPAHCNDS